MYHSRKMFLFAAIALAMEQEWSCSKITGRYWLFFIYNKSTYSYLYQ